MTATRPSTGAGWYPDPTTPGRIRYWDGKAWTENSLEAPPAQNPTWLGTAAGSGTKSRPWWRRWWAITIAAVAVLMIIGSLSPGSSDDKKSASPPATPAPTHR